MERLVRRRVFNRAFRPQPFQLFFMSAPTQQRKNIPSNAAISVTGIELLYSRCPHFSLNVV